MKYQVLSQVGAVIFTGSREACIAFIDNCNAKGIWELEIVKEQQ